MKDTEQDPATIERLRLMSVLLKESSGMTDSYRRMVSHTGSLVSTSMVYAYSKALNDVFKLLQKETNNEKPVQTQEG